MSREYCSKCERALRGCVCKFAAYTPNSNHVTILRHQSEIKSIKGTAILLSLSLENINLLNGEIFNKEDVLHPNLENILIFPDEESISTSEYKSSGDNQTKRNFIFIDGTWKKAYKILKLNPYLNTIPHLHLERAEKSPYSEIRKQRSGGVSTLEAVISALKFFNESASFEGLENSFDKFITYIKSLSN